MAAPPPNAQDDWAVQARTLRSSGADVEVTLSALRSRGATIAESLKVVLEVEGVSLGEAKRIIDESNAWHDRSKANDHIRRVAIESLALEASAFDDADVCVHPEPGP